MPQDAGGESHSPGPLASSLAPVTSELSPPFPSLPSPAQPALPCPQGPTLGSAGPGGHGLPGLAQGVWAQPGPVPLRTDRGTERPAEISLQHSGPLPLPPSTAFPRQVCGFGGGTSDPGSTCSTQDGQCQAGPVGPRTLWIGIYLGHPPQMRAPRCFPVLESVTLSTLESLVGDQGALRLLGLQEQGSGGPREQGGRSPVRRG